MNLIRNPHMTVKKSRDRTWGERLFTLPWRPLIREHVWHEPDPDIYVMEMPKLNFLNSKIESVEKTIVGHPETIAKLEKAIRDDEKITPNDPYDPSRRCAAWNRYY